MSFQRKYFNIVSGSKKFKYYFQECTDVTHNKISFRGFGPKYRQYGDLDPNTRGSASTFQFRPTGAKIWPDSDLNVEKNLTKIWPIQKNIWPTLKITWNSENQCIEVVKCHRMNIIGLRSLLFLVASIAVIRDRKRKRVYGIEWLRSGGEKV